MMRFTHLAAVPLLFLLAFLWSPNLQAQEYDLLLKNGHLLDAKNGINERMDVAIREGKIARIAPDIPESESEKVVNVSGLYVSPGIIDLHTHIFFGTNPDSDQMNSFRSVIPDMYSFRFGITTMVDAGSSGWRNFELFKRQTIAHSRTRILAMLRITGHGSRGGGYSQDLDDMDPEKTAEMAGKHPEIVGFKIAHYRGHDWEPIRRLVEAGRLADKPVMVDFGSADPPLPLETLFLEKLRPGDIYSHIYGGGTGGREAIVDSEGQVRPFVREAAERGILFDLGHGGGSFFYPVARPATEQGLYPHTISSDLHMSSVRNVNMQDINEVMSKMLALGMPLPDLVQASTWAPAQAIGREDLGHLSEGATADIWVFGVREGEFGFADVSSPPVRFSGDRGIETELTLFGGDVVWDLNARTVN